MQHKSNFWLATPRCKLLMSESYATWVSSMIWLTMPASPQPEHHCHCRKHRRFLSGVGGRVWGKRGGKGNEGAEVALHSAQMTSHPGTCLLLPDGRYHPSLSSPALFSQPHKQADAHLKHSNGQVSTNEQGGISHSGIAHEV